jgi:HSP20 family protein
MKPSRELAPTGARLAPSVRDPFAFLRRMTSELDRVFEEPRFLFTRPSVEREVWAPTMELLEKENHLVARFELPGLKKEEVNVEVKDGYVSVSGERKHETEEKKENYYRCEREYGSFFRSFALPEGVGAESVKAAMTDGVLEITMPLPAAAAPPAARKVEIAEPTAKKAAA